jgi:hypothetical protein
VVFTATAAPALAATAVAGTGHVTVVVTALRRTGSTWGVRDIPSAWSVRRLPSTWSVRWIP